ncbi:hypothetical protein ACF08W_28695 [Streptomyces sp. NPDC015144]|uniref:hypothetical protein n=1 Tax=Streptomyces sp. NPDC015144 TaxID=3364944 RepID=UPI0036FB2D1A
MTIPSWREAAQKLSLAGVGALYEHRNDPTQVVVVVKIDEPTDYMWWQRESGPNWGDRYRTMKCVDFLRWYVLKRRA